MASILQTHLSDLTVPTETALDHLSKAEIIERIWDKDHTVWSPDPTEISNRMGWMDSPDVMNHNIPEIDEVVVAVRDAGFTQALLLGMGGSSLAPELFRKIFGVAENHLDLAILDSTDPKTILDYARRFDPKTTLYIPATKSGGTVETISFLKFFYNQVRDHVGATKAGQHFIAITDPESGLEKLAESLHFRHIFRNDPNIGGRYSALSYFGLVPACLLGVDVALLLERAREAVNKCRMTTNNPGAILGTVMACGVTIGKDKLTLATTPSIAPLGPWIEQLIAESTGKNGTGIVPVDGESIGSPEQYGQDRLFTCIRLASDQNNPLDKLTTAGHSTTTITIDDLHDVAGQFILWEIATVIASHFLGINPYDQPNVELAKKFTQSITDTVHQNGELPSEEPTVSEGALALFGAPKATTINKSISAFLSILSIPAKQHQCRYVCLQAYLPPSPETDIALNHLRLAIRDRYTVATTVGYGPRFLHSTGQLHKGDAGRGLFIQLTCDDTEEATIPNDLSSRNSSMSFGILKKAQVSGDYQALINTGRRVLRIHLGINAIEGLKLVSQTLEEMD